MNILIVDDEPLARRRLAGLLAHLGSHQISMADHGEQALTKMAEQYPDVVFMDIEMPVMDGMEAAKIIHRDYPQTAIVFLTAHEQFALPAFDVKAVDYLLKPISGERLQETLDRIDGNQKDAIQFKDGGRFLRLPVNQVACFQAEDKYVTAHLKEKKYLLDQSLTELAQKYPQFIRIHRSWLVNVLFLRGIDSDETHCPVALLKQLDLKPPISRRQLPNVKDYLQT
ncbi:DNA-binding response regulator [Marinicella pacifica]|jgi:two-component system response regulator AlgR|uniref:DNA-binding response regulator n=1 Tax=Marinicella pacifica TaxID=1171543 RepID=A0A917CXU4_9GAMM|nr:LytTR family DNA-binding domain-containing protein [Marinicella pacifica]GGG01444.1 DNA-binding response regulator [Marinicella pacifica]